MSMKSMKVQVKHKMIRGSPCNDFLQNNMWFLFVNHAHLRDVPILARTLANSSPTPPSHIHQHSKHNRPNNNHQHTSYPRLNRPKQFRLNAIYLNPHTHHPTEPG